MNEIQDITSKGLSGLPHFRSSRVSMGMWEPVYQNLFTVAITLPEAIRNEVDTDLFLEGITKVSGLDTNKVPGADAALRLYAHDAALDPAPGNPRPAGWPGNAGVQKADVPGEHPV